MKNVGELKRYYDTVLLPELKILEGQRKKSFNKIIFGGAIVIPVTALLVLLTKSGLFIVLGAFVMGVVYYFSTKEYVGDFKSQIIQKIVVFIDENLTYSRARYVSLQSFVDSGIFKTKPNEYTGDDFVSGKLEKTQVQFSELYAQHVTRDSRGRKQYQTIFKGLFFVADFNKEFKGMTVILPDTAERLFGHVGTMLQSWNMSRGQLVKLEDPEFEKLFAVYGDDQIEARYILSTSLMDRIVKFKNKTKRTVYMSFVGSKIYVGVSYAKNLFEPRVFKTVLDFQPIKEYFEDLQLAVSIVEDLNLNTRIWTK